MSGKGRLERVGIKFPLDAASHAGSAQSPNVTITPGVKTGTRDVKFLSSN